MKKELYKPFKNETKSQYKYYVYVKSPKIKKEKKDIIKDMVKPHQKIVRNIGVIKSYGKKKKVAKVKTQK